MKRQLLFLTLALIIGGAMALHDTDKNSEDRGAPTPNHSDVLPSEGVKAHKTISSHYSSDADTSNTRLQMQNKQLIGNNGTSQIVNYGVQSDGNFALKFFDANGVGVARFGQYADGSIALKVAKSGQEVDSATNPNLIFNSNQDVFKIVATGTVSLTLNASYPSSNAPGVTVSVAHGLSSIPALIAYFGMNNNNFPGVVTGTQYSMPYVTFGGAYRFGYSIDTTNINFHFYNDSGVAANFSVNTSTATFKYYILQETAA